MRLFIGSGVAIATPFKNGAIDYDSLGELIEWHIGQKTDAIIVCGTTGESAALTLFEKKTIYKYVVDKVQKRIPVIGGTGTNNTIQALELSIAAQEAGVDALLLVTPYYNKGNRQGILQHYEYIANRVDIPMILYNVPSRTGVNLDANLVAELAQHKNIQGLKAACSDIAQIAETIHKTPKDFYVYAGNDDQILPILSLGGIGVISTVANIIPADTHWCVHHYLNLETKKAQHLQLNMMALVRALFLEVNPVPLKSALAKLGKTSPELRLPLAPMTKENEKILFKEMTAYGLL